MFRKHLLEKCIRYAVLTGYGPMRLLVMGYYMKPVSDSHSGIWNRILADHEVQFVSQSVNRLSLVGNHKLATANQAPWIDTWKVNSNTLNISYSNVWSLEVMLLGLLKNDTVAMVTADSSTNIGDGVGTMVGIEKMFCAIFTVATTIKKSGCVNSTRISCELLTLLFRTHCSLAIASWHVRCRGKLRMKSEILTGGLKLKMFQHSTGKDHN